MGGVQNSSGNSEGVKKWKFRGGGGGAYMKFPPWWGYGYFLELHNEKNRQEDEQTLTDLIRSYN